MIGAFVSPLDLASALTSARATGDPAREVLARIFGFPAFRGQQEAAVRQVIGGGDALVLMPTGGGKSLCYQVPALCRAGTAIVVSPLIALMDDQVAALNQLGVAAAALHSELPPAEAQAAGRALDRGALDLLYVSPERLLAPGMQERLSRQHIALIAIDEAHCVSQWGHEFRPEYRALTCLPERFPGVPRIALTATADPRTRHDILDALAMPDAAVFQASFHRPNLFLSASPKTTETGQLLDLLARHTGACGIVYCGSRARTERVAQMLARHGLPAVAFHAGLDPTLKREAAARFRSGEPVIVVATIAFGMGIDRPDVRFVAHLDMPDSPESYYQQIGRAGRDGDVAETLLLYGGQDIARARHWIAQSVAPEAQTRAMAARLEAMIALTETTACRTRALLACFGETLTEPCGHCDNCRAPAALVDGTEEARKLLSAVYRTGQIFGALHVIAVLRGERNEAIERHGHDKLAVFGLGAGRPRDFWRGVVRQMIALGALRSDRGNYAGLSLDSEVVRPILRGEVNVMLRAEAAPTPRAARQVSSPPAGAPRDTTLDPVAGARFERLRTWRLEQARAQAIPPYVIFHDQVLRDIAAACPADLEALGAIKGVGASKLARYGKAVLGLLGGGESG